MDKLNSVIAALLSGSILTMRHVLDLGHLKRECLNLGLLYQLLLIEIKIKKKVYIKTISTPETGQMTLNAYQPKCMN